MPFEASYHPFPDTHWSLVRRAGFDDGEARRAALTTLLLRYQPALRSYLRVVRRVPEEQAEDLLQAFIADRILESDLLKQADSTRGRFRSLLLTSLNNFAVSRYRSAKRREMAPIEMESPAPTISPTMAMDIAWARALVNEVLKVMQHECFRSGRMDVWTVFESRILAQAAQQPPASYDQLSLQLNLQSPVQAANLLVTGKRMYARLLRSAISEYEQQSDHIDAELAELRGILEAGGHLHDSSE